MDAVTTSRPLWRRISLIFIPASGGRVLGILAQSRAWHAAAPSVYQSRNVPLTGEYERMKRPLFASNLCVALLVTLGACGGDDNGIDFGAPPPGPYRLTLEGDESFQGPHGGHSINVVVISRNLGGLAVAEDEAIISSTSGTGFDFGFARLLAEGVPHDVYYWIDSNIGGGNVGTCDPPEIDHQWTSAVRNPRANIEIAHSHNDADNIDVCFAFSLSSIE